MQFIICPRHNKVEKAAHKLTTNCFVCMNRYCQQSFLPLCSQCKPDHRDHSNKILTLEDIAFLIQRLLKTPFKQLSSYIDEAVSAMKKFKLVQENRRRIEQLQRQIQSEVVGLVEWTEQLVHQYAKCKNKVNDLGDLLVNIQTPTAFHSFTSHSHQLLSNLEYNYQKDKFQYGNTSIRQRYQSRRKSYELTRRKLQQVKDYSMKIIEVILANQDDDSEGEDDIVYKKKMYEILKKEIYQLANENKNAIHRSNINKDKQTDYHNQQKDREKQKDSQNTTVSLQLPSIVNTTNEDTKSRWSSSTITGNISSSSTIATKCQPPIILSIQKSSQTCPQWLKSIQQSKKQYELKIKRIQQVNAKSINQLQNKISMLVGQKQTLKKESSLIADKYNSRTEHILQIENRLRANRAKREQIQKSRQSQFQKLIQIANWRPILEGDLIH